LESTALAAKFIVDGEPNAIVAECPEHPERIQEQKPRRNLSGLLFQGHVIDPLPQPPLAE
jgi:hypothetical protein